jgi:transcription initiation factor TFIIB
MSITPKILQSEAMEKLFNDCPNCKNQQIIFDSNNGEMICTSCGMIIEDRLDSAGIESEPMKNLENNLSVGMPLSLAHYDKGLSTTISPSNVDAFGSQLNTNQLAKIRTIRHWNKISSNNRSYHRNLKNAFGVLLRIKDKLSLSDTITEKSAYYYRKVVEKRITKGRSIKEFVVACVYVACREMNVPRTLDEIAEIANADKVFAGKCYRLLLRNLKIRLQPIDSTTYLSKIANKGGISKKTLNRSIDMMSQIKEHPFSSGKDPTALSIAVLYAACLEQGENISQSQVAIAGEMSVVTLRKRFLDVKKIFPHIPNNTIELRKQKN